MEVLKELSKDIGDLYVHNTLMKGKECKSETAMETVEKKEMKKKWEWNSNGKIEMKVKYQKMLKEKKWKKNENKIVIETVERKEANENWEWNSNRNFERRK